MRITDFELQTATGQYWLDIQERLAPLADLRSENDALKATLTEHQSISDALVTRAEAVVSSGDYTGLREVLADAKVYADARETARKTAEIAELAAKISDLEAKRLSLLGTLT